ncbi:MAG: hypothetical protein M3Y33_09435 [Actinomycetota bacterium]|nr:hypothetical protein [Actinomycetota bacterium]
MAVSKAAKIRQQRAEREAASCSLLAQKLTVTRRVSHVDDLLTDPASALFAGLPVLPRKSALTDHSYRLAHHQISPTTPPSPGGKAAASSSSLPDRRGRIRCVEIGANGGWTHEKPEHKGSRAACRYPRRRCRRLIAVASSGA